jgi:hypothetical protein
MHSFKLTLFHIVMLGFQLSTVILAIKSHKVRVNPAYLRLSWLVAGILDQQFADPVDLNNYRFRRWRLWSSWRDDLNQLVFHATSNVS